MPPKNFPVISQGERPPGEQPQTWDEEVFGDHPEWKEGKKGSGMGKVTITEEFKDNEKKFRAEFEFDDAQERKEPKEKVDYSGDIPGKGAWQGRSRIKKGKGPPKFRDEIDVESVNPKRWG